MTEIDGDITQLLHRVREGDRQALEQLMPVVYRELQQIAHGQLRRLRGGETLRTTALVHEAYMRLARGAENVDWEDRCHFFATAAVTMRRLLVDHARRKAALRRGGDRPVFSLDDREIAFDSKAEAIVVIDDLLDRLHALNPRLSRVVEYRFFGGLEEKEIAAVMRVTPRTVRRDWVKARAWLYREMTASG